MSDRQVRTWADFIVAGRDCRRKMVGSEIGLAESNGIVRSLAGPNAVIMNNNNHGAAHNEFDLVLIYC